jgi:hypothetical protein
MPILVIVIAIAAIAAGWWLLDVPPAGMDTLVVVKDANVSIKRGHLRPPVLADVRALLSEAQVAKGYIGVARRRISFSRTIPRSLRQKLRNVILNG